MTQLFCHHLAGNEKRSFFPQNSPISHSEEKYSLCYPVLKARESGESWHNKAGTPGISGVFFFFREWRIIPTKKPAGSGGLIHSL
jgi:hypothetical protein